MVFLEWIERDLGLDPPIPSHYVFPMPTTMPIGCCCCVKIDGVIVDHHPIEALTSCEGGRGSKLMGRYLKVHPWIFTGNFCQVAGTED